MLTTRVYRPAMSLDEALYELDSNSSTQFCPRCVDAVKRVAPRLRMADNSSRWQLLAVAS
jgi:HD-GYP domain-containing protein (c-di-GMP phosphodiesterase class II)